MALFNSVGQLVLETGWPAALSKGVELDLAGLPGGPYFLRISRPDQRSVFKRLVVTQATP